MNRMVRPAQVVIAMRIGVVIVCAVAAGLLLSATQKHAYSYYTMMRWIVTAIALLVAWYAYAAEIWWVIPVFVVLAILFNPIIPVTMTKKEWATIDKVSAVVFVVAGIVTAVWPPKVSHE